MKEHEFLLELEKRAQEQERLIKKLLLPKVFYSLCLWFGEHPWRVMIPFSFLLTILFWLIFGDKYFELILRIFGGP